MMVDADAEAAIRAFGKARKDRAQNRSSRFGRSGLIYIETVGLFQGLAGLFGAKAAAVAACFIFRQPSQYGNSRHWNSLQASLLVSIKNRFIPSWPIIMKTNLN